MGIFKLKHRSSNFKYPRVGASQLFEFHEDIFKKTKIPALTPNLGEKFGFIKRVTALIHEILFPLQFLPLKGVFFQLKMWDYGKKSPFLE